MRKINMILLIINLLFHFKNEAIGQQVYFIYDQNKNVEQREKTFNNNYDVYTTLDYIIGSLRDAIENACPEDTIRFNSILYGDTITLTGPEIKIHRQVYIYGPNMNNLTISGGFNSRIFNIEQLNNVGLEGLKLIHGSNSSEGGAVFNQSETHLKNIIFENNFEGTFPKALTNKGKIIIEGEVIIRE